jgi:hypothetical protein
MREICKSGSEGGAGQTNVPFLPLSKTKSKLLLVSAMAFLGGCSMVGLPLSCQNSRKFTDNFWQKPPLRWIRFQRSPCNKS